MKKKLDFLKLYFDDDADNIDGVDTGDENNDGNENEQDKDNEKIYSKADVNKIIQKRLAREKAANEEALRLERMTAQERAEHERDQFKQELEELKRANTIAELEKTARGILTKDGINVPDELVSALVTDDAGETNTRVKAFSKLFREAVKSEVKSQLSHKGPSTGRSVGGITKAEIFAEKDLDKQQELIRQNLSLFRK